jgi:hypothetical protein
VSRHPAHVPEPLTAAQPKSRCITVSARQPAAIGNIGQSGAVALQAVIHSYQCGASETWDVTGFTMGADSTVGTNYSATGAANLNLASGDWLVVGCCATDVANGTTPASEALTATGITFGTLNIRTEAFDSPTSQNLWILYWDRSVTSGTSSAAPVQTWTWAGSGQEGSSAFLRLRAAVSNVPVSGSDTATGTDNAGTVVQKYTGSETGSGTDDTSARKTPDTDSGSAADSTAARAFTEADLGAGTDSPGAIRQSGSETALGTDSGGTVSATVTGSGETGTGTEAHNKTMTEAESTTGTDNAGMVTQPRSGSDTATGTDDAGYLRIIKTDSDNTGTWTDTHTNRRFDGQSDNPTITEGETQSVLLPQNKSGSDTSSAAEGQTRLQPGGFSQIPIPKVWSNGDDLDHGTLNKEWRDTFNWMLRLTPPAFSGYNADGAALTYTSNVAIPIKVEELKRGNLQHAANDTKVYVYEPGNYLAMVNVGIAAGSITANGTNLSSVLKINGVVQSAGDVIRAAGGLVGVQHMVSVYLNAGDYVEIALGGTWTGTATAGTTTAVYPWLILWWRSN